MAQNNTEDDKPIYMIAEAEKGDNVLVLVVGKLMFSYLKKMKDNQINGQKINKEAYCPNSFFNNDTISIGEFKTLDDAMNFPIKEIWCINRTEDNKFQSYKSQGSRLFIICSWNRSTQDPLKFVLALIHKDKVGKLYYLDMNDLPLYPDEKKNQYEDSLGDDATYTLYQIANN